MLTVVVAVCKWVRGGKELSLESLKNSIKDNIVQQTMIHPFPTHTESWHQPGEQRHLR